MRTTANGHKQSALVPDGANPPDLGEPALQRCPAPERTARLLQTDRRQAEAAEALGRRDEARAAYEHAAALYPQAQAPLFALSQLAMRDGDTTRAVKALENVLLAASEPAPDDDPFWTYHTAPGRDADALLVQAYRALSEAGRR